MHALPPSDVRSARRAPDPHDPPAPDPVGRAAPEIDVLIARTAARLRHAGRPVCPVAFDALVEDVVHEAVSFALRWADV